LKRQEKLKFLQNEQYFAEFNRLTALLILMEEYRKKRIRIDIAIELSNEMFIGILMVLFSSSETKTETGLEALFQVEG
jgi:hypothetical protein